jgi:chloride channel protein, CIC family
MFTQRLIKKLNYLKDKYFGDRTYLILASIAIGIVSALAAVILKHFVRFVYSMSDLLLSWSHTSYIYILSPLVGILLTLLVIRIFFKGKLEKGLGSIIFSIARRSGKIEGSKMYSHLLTSGLTIGFGGSAGLEAPIVITGSAIGSNIATFLKFGNKERTLFSGMRSGIRHSSSL